jgi:AraC-like DNA-binding protein
VKRVEWHSHEDYELLFMLEGANIYEIRGRDAVESSGGHLLLMPPGAVHRGRDDVRMPSVLCGILFQPCSHRAWVNSIFTREELRRMDRELRKHPFALRPFNRELTLILARLIQHVEAFKSDRRDTFAKANLRALACLAIIESLRQLATSARTDAATIASAARDYLEKRFAEPVQMTDLAQHLGLSRARMFEVFKKHTGRTPNDYLLRHRIERAREQLAKTSRSITDIALDVGFSSSQYFANVFRRYTGMTPLAHRQRPSNQRCQRGQA